TGDDLERVPVEQTRLAQLLGGAAQAFDLAGEGLLDPDIEVLGADHVGRDQHALEDRVGIPADQEAVLERARLALGGVADHAALRAGMLADRAPLGAGGKPAAAAAAQAGLLDLGEDRARRRLPRFLDRVFARGL